MEILPLTMEILYMYEENGNSACAMASQVFGDVPHQITHALPHLIFNST